VECKYCLFYAILFWAFQVIPILFVVPKLKPKVALIKGIRITDSLVKLHMEE
jgi:hypothetical protein